MSPELEAIVQRNMNPPPGEQPAPYFAAPDRKVPAARPTPKPKPPAAVLTAEQILAAYDRRGSWGEAARELDVTEYHLRDRRRELGLHVPPKVTISDEQVLVAYAEHGSHDKAATALGIAKGGSFSRRLKAALAR